MASFIEFPIFTGVSGDLRPWISWLENFFVREKFTADEKLNLAQSLLEGEAEVWFYRNQKMLPFQSWEDLKANLWLMFGDFAYLDRIRRNPVNRCRKTTSLHTIESFSATEPIEKAVCSSAKDESITQTQVAAISGEKKELKKEVDLSLEKIASPLTLPNTKATIKEKITVEKSSNQQNIIEEFSENVADILEEKKLIPQCQVPNSSLEPSLSFSCESLVVSDARQSEIVSNNWVHSQSVLECVKNKATAYQVFDKTSPHKERLKSKPKRKLSLSPKTWMFKFKNKNLQRQYSCSRATFGYKWKEHNSRYWRRIRQTNLSRLLCISQTNAEKALEALKEIQSQQATVMRDGTKVSSLPAKELVPGDIVELRVGDKLQFLCEKVSIVSCLSLDAQFKSLEVVMVVLKVHHRLRNTRFTSSEMKQFVGFMMFQLKHKWRSKHLHTISAWEFYLSSVFPTVTSANSCSGYKRMHEQLQVHTILIVNDVKSQVKHNWRLVWRLWRLHNQWFVLVILQLREPYGWSGARGLGRLILDDLKSHMRHKWKSKHLRAVFGLQTSPSYALDVVNTTTKPWVQQNNFELCVGHDKDIMRLKLLLYSGCDGEKLAELDFHFGVNLGLLVFPWNLMLLEFLLFFHLEDKVGLSGASNSGCGWLVFDRGNNHIISGDVITRVFLDLKKCFFHGAEKRDVQTMLLVKAEVAHVDSLIVWIKVILCYGVALGKEIQWAEIQQLSLYKELWNKSRLQEINLTDTKFLCEKVHRVSCLPLAAQFNSLEIIQAVLQQILQVNDDASTKIIDKLQKSLSIWHRWRRKD